MERGHIDLASVDGGFDLQSTLESGQTYLWWREDGHTYEETPAYGGDAWYVTTTRRTDGGEPAAVRVRQRDGSLEWESTIDAEPILRRRLRLDDDLDAMRRRSCDDDLVQAAYDEYWGMRLVREPPVPTLVSFICSPQMRVARIFAMQTALRERFGEPVSAGDTTYHAFPTADRLAAATESELRDLGLGYRAPYVNETARMIADGEAHPADARSMDYEAARTHLTKFVGVGEKVADCVLLFSLDFIEAVPLDTWIQRSIEEYYPHCARDSYVETSRAIREHLGGPVAGYAQTYLFHLIRTRKSAELEALLADQ